ncbi:phosphotransferase [Pseudooceanicola sp. CBS1P-1]|uniref:Phosphotransferase n=1 Tax=Pseudooceanicola albus TaxID=2692189 RepID=A0A6L7G2F1_9RHOB|nr:MULTISPECIES: phosphotransferase [Pseudooceanicola]MBT9385729.1 phosphotransferase [Pseudooceanicola endophyticus]MXN16763.1 phosphotransferase [Pseudooceanicola albus]
MTDRSALKQTFLAGTDWAGAQIRPLAGDASMRKYDRLTRADGSTAVLMDAPPEKGEDVRPFLRIANHLTGIGLSAPQILAGDPERGFLLLEDLGDALYARAVAAHPESAPLLYGAAVDALQVLHTQPMPVDLPPYDPPLMTRLAALAYEWYVAGATDRTPYTMTAFSADFLPRLSRATGMPSVVILRDFHAENLLWLPEREGPARVGLLDFQDALMGHPAYDLVSLLQDARRDVPEELEAQMIARFTAASGHDPETFRLAYDMLGVQRNLRILGVFARLCMAHGKPHYVDFIPRVWGYLRRTLERPGLEEIRARLVADLPEPTPEVLDRLKEKCATRPLP